VACDYGRQGGVGQTDRGGAGSKLWSGDELGAYPPDADKLAGIEKRGDAADGSMIAGVKAPVLNRPMASW
jgi:hypothetical protein